MNDKLVTKTKRITAYALACGHVERKEENNIRLTLWHEHGCYHVRAHEFDGRGRLFWQSFDKLIDARSQFDTQLKQLFA